MKWSEVAQSCLTLCHPVDCSLAGSSLHGILQARVLEWVAISFSRVSSQPRDQTRVSCIVGRCFNLWATREAMQDTRVQSLGWEIPWRRQWQPTPVFLPGKFHGQRSLVDYSLWGCKELDMTEWLTLSLSTYTCPLLSLHQTVPKSTILWCFLIFIHVIFISPLAYK